jgi:hypothetical protein
MAVIGVGGGGVQGSIGEMGKRSGTWNQNP